MAEVELESVLEFLRNNGLTQCESALVEDVMEKSQLGSSEFEKLFFPMAPPLRILSSGLLPEHSYAVGVTSKSSSDDDFVSLGSSTTELCSSEFTNPYGIRTACPSSQPSSDRLSQFGTARDYPDFEMQNDLFWYKEKDEDFAMPDDTEFYNDKYITTIDEACCDVFILEKNPDKCRQVSSDCACCDGGSNVYTDHADYNLVDLKSENATGNFVRADGTYDCVGVMDEFHEVKDNVKNKNGNYEFVCDEVVADESNGPQVSLNEGYERKEDDFEIFNLRIIHWRNRTGFEENRDFPVVMSSIIGGRYYVTELLESAAFSKVVQAHDLCLGIDVCLKITKNDKDFFDQSLDEIKLLKFVNKHDPSDECHILRLYDYFYFQEHLFIVTELLRANLYEFQKYNQESGGQPYFTLHRLQRISRQCLEALSYLHELGVIHCDLKPENILIKSYRKCDIKIIDLGSSCFETDKLCEYVQSRSYRAPEVMLGLPYNHKIDLWSLGCILVELCTGQVLFPNEAIVMLLARMIGLLGPIDAEMLQQGQHTHKYFTKQSHLYYIKEETGTVEYIVPDETRLEDHLVDVSDSCFIEFLKYLLEINPKRRPTAREALHHPWLSQPITCM